MHSLLCVFLFINTSPAIRSAIKKYLLIVFILQSNNPNQPSGNDPEMDEKIKSFKEWMDRTRNYMSSEAYLRKPFEERFSMELNMLASKGFRNREANLQGKEQFAT